MSEFTQFLKTSRALSENRVSLFDNLALSRIPKLLEDLKSSYVLATEQAYENVLIILPNGTSESCSDWLSFLNEIDTFAEKYPVSCSVSYVTDEQEIVDVVKATSAPVVIIIGSMEDFNLHAPMLTSTTRAIFQLFNIDKKILWLKPDQFESQPFMFTIQLNFWASYADIYDGIFWVTKDKFGRCNRGLSLTDIPFSTLKEQHHEEKDSARNAV